MTQFRFQVVVTKESSPTDWFRFWASRYTGEDEAEYQRLIAERDSYGHDHFVRMGKWKEGVSPEGESGKWKANVASVAYAIWMQLAEELPRVPEEHEVPRFLSDLERREYQNTYTSGSRTMHFGLSRATTVLHFLSGARYPIYDSRVWTAFHRLTGAQIALDGRGLPDSGLSSCRRTCEYV